MKKINYEKLINSEDFENNTKYKFLDDWLLHIFEDNNALEQLHTTYFDFYDIMEYRGKISTNQKDNLQDNLFNYKHFLTKLIATCPYIKIEINNSNMGA